MYVFTIFDNYMKLLLTMAF